MAQLNGIRIKRAGYHHGDLRRALMQKALKVIDRRGVDALTLNDLAIRTGVSPGAPYHHFSDRAALLAAIAQEGFELLESEMRQASEAALQTPAAKLQALGRA
jgi:AcrR family transcriptional regulator